MDKKLNKDAHIKQIEEALSKLQQLSSEFAEPASIQLQLLGTAVDNTTGGLASALNSISDNPKVVRFGHDLNWMSYMGSVHRSFFTSLLAVTEEGLKELCSNKGLVVHASKRMRMERVIDTVNGISRRQKIKLLSFVGEKPEFMDYLQTAMTINNKNQYYPLQAFG